jgi:DNA-binding NarL/FixJ family response regulator
VIRVLLADDHAVVRDGLRVLLEGASDIEVVGDAGNGRDAVRLAAKAHPDVVVMDIAMPEMNGIEATELLQDTTPATQVVILSMHSTAEHSYRALQAGARGYLLKDSAGSEVVEAVRTVNIGRRYLSQKIAAAVVDDYIAGRRQASPLDSLSRRERQILQLIVEGCSSADVARKLFLSPKTVETYRSRMMHKLGVGDLPHLVKFALQHGVTQLD